LGGISTAAAVAAAGVVAAAVVGVVAAAGMVVVVAAAAGVVMVRYHLGENVYIIIKAPQLTIHIRKHFVPNGEWTLHPTKIGVTLSLYE
jgi:hypothetical protein